MFDLVPQNCQTPRIAVFGVGGCGCNTIKQLSLSPLGDNVELIAVNTDAQSLLISNSSTRLQIGPETTKGLGAGARPQKGFEAAEESQAALREHIELADIIFVTGGMGGGTGTGAIPFMAAIAKDLNKPLVAVVTTPFSFEGHQRGLLAQNGVDDLMQHASAVIVLPNDQLVKALDKKVSIVNAFYESNRILQDVLQGLTTTISQSGLINIDLNDFIAVVSHQGRAAMGVARQVAGEDLQLTINKALKNPLLEEVKLSKAKGAIVSVMATESIELSQYNSIGETLQQQLDPSALVIIGLTIVPELDCELELMVIATGIQEGAESEFEIFTELQQPKVTKSQDQIQTKSHNERFDANELVNLHDFLKQKSTSSANEDHGDDELEIPTYTRNQRAVN
ncbi:cell division protein FtsZ [Shewanella schlegeliana]|uniref:Cell division protein FtsZ n=1 Tax=Shewanella schlegeliana TaxID=190308 RepID=A0ABS1SU81_9GAMM|nr:cell division protein FtsZ [Shewanella schlegeliana]MBL4912086.1 cell division protein FtsZ [Shewanella schlegeliana]MCL1111316.1 cell division protein FtsZ [Shewanella schlegeliana]GIU32991.1 cell division protein FtsZ [Shewanella schlegeliana]